MLRDSGVAGGHATNHASDSSLGARHLLALGLALRTGELKPTRSLTGERARAQKQPDESRQGRTGENAVL